MNTKPLSPCILGLFACLTSLAFAADKPASLRYEPEIRAFEAADRTSPPPKGAVLFIGSSTIRLWKTLAKDFPDQQVLNRGFGGCEIADCAYFADRIVVPYEPRLIVLRAGVNDIAAGKSPERVRDDFLAFVSNVRAKLPKVRIAYLSMNATPARWGNVEREKKANQLIHDCVGRGENLDFINASDTTLGPDRKPRADLFVKDRIHFNAAGYRLLATAVRPHLK
jgi:lysophospholipase L1-like esterase